MPGKAQQKARGAILYFLLSALIVGGGSTTDMAFGAAPSPTDAGEPSAATKQTLPQIVDAAMSSIRAEYDVAGMAVGITIDGQHQFFNDGVASRASKRPVSRRTVFEIGSDSKTFAAAVAEEARAQGRFQWNDAVSAVVPALRGSAFDRIRMWQLGTHSAGLPLNFPDDVDNEAAMLRYLKQWTPSQDRTAADSQTDLHRLYSNVGTGVLGWAAAQSVGRDYADIVQNDMLPALGMRDTFLTVPRDRMQDYAQGYTRDDHPIRVHPGMLGDEAYGIKSSAADLVHYLDLQIEAGRMTDAQASGAMRAASMTRSGSRARRDKWLAAFRGTQQPWIRAGAITQDVMWEQIAYPVSLAALESANGFGAALKRLPATKLAQHPTSEGTADGSESPMVWINKTGSTNGFGSYLVFIPQRRIGLVMLFNKNVPIEARVAAAARIVSAIDPTGLRQ